MILPTKHLPAEKSLLVVGASILELLEQPQSPSTVWSMLRSQEINKTGSLHVTYEWFVIALDFLYAVKAVDFENGLVLRASS